MSVEILKTKLIIFYSQVSSLSTQVHTRLNDFISSVNTFTNTSLSNDITSLDTSYSTFIGKMELETLTIFQIQKIILLLS